MKHLRAPVEFGAEQRMESDNLPSRGALGIWQMQKAKANSQPFDTVAFRRLRFSLCFSFLAVGFVHTVACSALGFWMAKHSNELLSNDHWAVLHHPLVLLVGADAFAFLLLAATSYFLVDRAIRPAREDVEFFRQFTHDVGHELATPITVLRSRLQIIERELADLGANSNQVNVLAEAAKRMSNLVDDLRALARSESPENQLQLSLVKTDNLVSHCVEELKPEFDKKEMHVYIESLQPITVVADADGLHRILYNLLSNACRYGEHRGNVWITAKQDHGNLLIAVRDDGPGISEEDLPHLFNRFYRTEHSRARESGGSGLGLAIVKAIAESHGGKVGVTSTIGEGTQFTVKVPRFPTRHPALTRF